jgi:hypothetical protein
MNQYEVTLLGGTNFIVSAETKEEAGAIVRRVTDKRPVTVEFLNTGGLASGEADIMDAITPNYTRSYGS